jgi:Ca2+-binding RTX toxin-like protein
VALVLAVPPVAAVVVAAPAFAGATTTVDIPSGEMAAALPRCTGASGNDLLTGGSGADTLLGRAGDQDVLHGGPGYDTLDGGSGPSDLCYAEADGGTKAHCEFPIIFVPPF